MNCPYCMTENLPGATRCAACTSWMVERRPAREWARAREGKAVAGVCRGLADQYGVPVAALRLAFILSIFLGGWGVIAYIALWIAMPYRDQLPPHNQLPPQNPLPVREEPRPTST